MTGLLLAALERLPPRVRRFVVAAAALLALGAVMAALTLTAPRGGHKQRLAPQRPAAVRLLQTSPHRIPPPVSTAALFQARQVAARFLAGYLPFAYGRDSGLAIQGITPALRRELLRERARLTPVERRRRPRVMSLQRSARRRRSWSQRRASTTAGCT
jgi:hypothetical protein